MPAGQKSSPALQDQVQAQLRLIRNQVAGVRGSLAATSDGLVFAHDVPDLEPAEIAAISAATLSLASHATLASGCGSFREAVARGSNGYLAVYAAGASAIVAVIGTSSLNLGLLQFRAREIIDRIGTYSTQIGAAPGRTAAQDASAPPPRQARGTGGAPAALPRRRPAAS
jgi:predicted regulator of Ras-like GTPase activity (Roadblock/LC7/MglB family)